MTSRFDVLRDVADALLSAGENAAARIVLDMMNEEREEARYLGLTKIEAEETEKFKQFARRVYG